MRYKPLIYISLIIAAFAFVIIGCTGGGGSAPPPDDGVAVDTTAASIFTVLPADSTTDVSVNANIVIKFDEAVYAGTGNVYIYDDTDTLFKTVDVGSAQVTGFGTATIVIDPDPVEDFAQSTGYYILIDAGAFKDASNNSFAGITDKTIWSFQTGTASDSTQPSVSGLFPAAGAIDISLNAGLVLTFDEAVIVGTGNVSIYDSGNVLFEEIDVSSGQLTGFGTETITVDPSVDFTASTGYYVQIDAGAFKDISNNNYTGIADTTTWSFTTGLAPDSTPPSISVLSPVDNEIAALPTADLVITYDEAVIAGEGMVTIYDSGDTLFEAINVASIQVSGSGTDSITIDPTDDFTELTDYYVLVDPGSFSDTAGNDFSGVTDAASWNFGVRDDTPPAIIKTYPVDGSTAVPWNANLILVFSEAVNAGTGNITVSDTSGVIETIDVNSGQVTGFGTDTIYIDRSDIINLTAFDNHYIQIDATAFVDTSPTANPFAGITDTTTWSFTAGVSADSSSPLISSQIPSIDLTGVPTNTNLKITFDEVVFVDTGNISIYESGPILREEIDVISSQVTGSWTDTITIDPADFPSTWATYWVEIPDTAFYDISGNYFAGIGTMTWNFTTGDGPDTTPPAIADTATDLDPYAGEEDVVLDAGLSITFDETVYAGSGNIRIYDSGDTLVESIDVGSAQVTGLGTATISVDPAADFDGLTVYYVLVDATAFKDIANNYFAGITDSVTWSFTTEIGDLLGGVESFDYGDTGGDLDTVSSVNWTETNGTPTTKVQYNTANGYSDPGYSSGAGGTATGRNDGADSSIMKRSFIATADKNAVYLGFIVAGIMHPESSSGFGVAFHDTFGTRLGGVYFVGGAAAGPNERYTIQLSDGSTTIEIAEKRKPGTAYLVVVKYDFSTGILSAFFNPDVTLAEPVSDASNSFTVSSSWTDIDSFVLDESWQSGVADCTYDIDEIKVVKSWGLLAE
jgi:hypothetical protein